MPSSLAPCLGAHTKVDSYRSLIKHADKTMVRRPHHNRFSSMLGNNSVAAKLARCIVTLDLTQYRSLARCRSVSLQLCVCVLNPSTRSTSFGILLVFSELCPLLSLRTCDNSTHKSCLTILLVVTSIGNRSRAYERRRFSTNRMFLYPCNR